jgi:multidrug resistance protein, MATE family
LTRPAPLSHNARRIATLAWPVLVGQLSVLAFSTVDTLLVARSSAADLAALAVGAAVYITIFIGLMGVVMALSPIVGQLYGAGRLREAGQQVHQALWVAGGMATLGVLALVFPTPFLALAQVGPEVQGKVRGYLLVLALALPGSLLFTVYRGFNTAVSRPKAVMALQLSGLALKIPLSTALVFGVPALGVPALGVLGCAISTALVMWAQVLAAWAVVRRDPFYARFHITGRRLDRPHGPALRQHLKLGLPLGGSIMVEVTGFAFMAIFIARLGTTSVAAHQLAANLVSMMFMVPLALGNATSTLVAQRVGAHDHADGRRLAWHGLALGSGLATLLATLVFVLREPVLALYTRDAAVVGAALPLVAWLAVFHVADAVQAIAAFVLRAHKIVTLPLGVYVVALWGVGLGGGYVLAFNLTGQTPTAWQGAPGFWMASTVSLLLAGATLAALMARVLKPRPPGGEIHAKQPV